jgi:hypothetical protein
VQRVPRWCRHHLLRQPLGFADVELDCARGPLTSLFGLEQTPGYIAIHPQLLLHASIKRHYQLCAQRILVNKTIKCGDGWLGANLRAVRGSCCMLLDKTAGYSRNKHVSRAIKLFRGESEKLAGDKALLITTIRWYHSTVENISLFWWAYSTFSIIGS